MFKRKLSSMKGDHKEPSQKGTAIPESKKKEGGKSKKSSSSSPPPHPLPSALSDYVNRERILILSSRGTSHLHRHFLSDLVDLLPHCKKDSKLDTKDNLTILNEVAELKNCSHSVFLETRKHSDLYMWMAATPHGPSVKFLVQSIQTMADVRFTGNSLKGSRPLIVFDGLFDSTPSFRLIKQILQHIFNAPKGHPHIKPFVDHCLSFFLLDNRIWCRHYQIVYDADINQIQKAQQQQLMTPTLESLQALHLKNDPILIEIGPRFVLNPIKLFNGSFSGTVLWENPHYQSPNAIRAILAAKKGMRYDQRLSQYEATELHKKEAADKTVLNPIDSIFSGTEVDREEKEKTKKIVVNKKKRNAKETEEVKKGGKANEAKAKRRKQAVDEEEANGDDGEDNDDVDDDNDEEES